MVTRRPAVMGTTTAGTGIPQTLIALSPSGEHWYRRQNSSICYGWSGISEKRIVAATTDGSVLAWSCEPSMVIVTTAKCIYGNVHQASDRCDRYEPKQIHCPSQVTALCLGYVPLSGCTTPLGFPISVRPEDQESALLLAIGLKSGPIRIHSVETGQLLIELLDHWHDVEGLTFSPCYSKSHSILLSCSKDSTSKVWDLKDGGNLSRTLRGHNPFTQVLCCSWSSDGLWAATGGSDRMLIVWCILDWSISCRAKLHRNSVVDCEFSPDSALVVSCSHDTTAVIFDHLNGIPLVTLRHEIPVPRRALECYVNYHYVHGLSFSPDGEHIATICSDDNMRIWNISSPQFPCKVIPVKEATSVCYVRNGASIAFCSSTGKLEVISAPMSVQRLSVMCRRALRRNFHWEELRRFLLPTKLHSLLAYRELLWFEDCRPILPEAKGDSSESGRCRSC